MSSLTPAWIFLIRDPCFGLVFSSYKALTHTASPPLSPSHDVLITAVWAFRGALRRHVVHLDTHIHLCYKLVCSPICPEHNHLLYCVFVCVCVCVQLTAGAEGGLKEEAFLHDAQAGAAAERVRLHAAVPGDGAAPGTGGAGQVY